MAYSRDKERDIVKRARERGMSVDQIKAAVLAYRKREGSPAPAQPQGIGGSNVGKENKSHVEGALRNTPIAGLQPVADFFNNDQGKKKSTLRKVADFFTGNTQRFADTLGTAAAAAGTDADETMNEAHIDEAQARLDLAKRLRGASPEEAAKIRKLLSQGYDLGAATDRLDTLNKTGKQVAGEGVGFGVELLQGGAYSKAGKIAQGAVKGQKFLRAVGEGAKSGAIYGGVGGLSQGLQDDGDAAHIAKTTALGSGIGAGVGAAAGAVSYGVGKAVDATARAAKKTAAKVGEKLDKVAAPFRAAQEKAAESADDISSVVQRATDAHTRDVDDITKAALGASDDEFSKLKIYAGDDLNGISDDTARAAVIQDMIDNGEKVPGYLQDDARRLGVGTEDDFAKKAAKTAPKYGSKAERDAAANTRRLGRDLDKDFADKARKLAEEFKTSPDRLEPRIKELADNGIDVRDLSLIADSTPEDRDVFRKMFKSADMSRKSFDADREINEVGRVWDKKLRAAETLLDETGAQLDEVMRDKIGNKYVKLDNEFADFSEDLAKVNIKVKDGKLDFSNSRFDNAPATLRSEMQKMYDLLKPGENGKSRALAKTLYERRMSIFEKTKTQSVKEGLSPQAKALLEKYRKAFMEPLRNIDDDFYELSTKYAKLESAIEGNYGLLGKDRVGKFDDRVPKLGELSMRYMSNVSDRVANPITKLEDVLREYSADTKLGSQILNTSIGRQAAFANFLERTFGTTQKTSLAGRIGQALDEAGVSNAATAIASGDVKGAALRGLGKVVGKQVSKVYDPGYAQRKALQSGIRNLLDLLDMPFF